MATKDSVRYQLKVILTFVKPSIWRRIVVPGNLTLWQLHTVLQVIMEWEESHLHLFEIQDARYGDPSDNEMGLNNIKDEHLFKLERVIPRQVGYRFSYTYDFGDSWEHVLLVEKILPPDKADNLPVCLKGSRAGALEDSGGPVGYMQVLAARHDPEHPDHLDAVEWIGETFDPEFLDIDEINQRLKLLAEHDYQLEELIDSEDIDEGEAAFIFGDWVQNLTDELKQACQNLALRRDITHLLTYLRDHRVKGTATGNLPLKAVREIVAGMVEPPELDYEDRKLRSEEDVDELIFLHTLAFASGLVTGGAQQRWELSEDGSLFLEFPPAAQVLQLFLSWSVRMRWTFNLLFSVLDENTTPMARLEMIRQLADQPSGEWLPFRPLAQRIGATAGWQWPDARSPEHNQTLLTLGAYALVIDPMIRFEAVEFRQAEGKEHSYEHENSEIRFTPLGKSLLSVVKALVQQG